MRLGDFQNNGMGLWQNPIWEQMEREYLNARDFDEEEQEKREEEEDA